MNLPTTNPLKRRAHALLDDVRAGLHHEPAAVVWALRCLGEPVALPNLHPLETPRFRLNGPAPLCHLRVGAEVAIPRADVRMSAALTGTAGSAGSASGVAR